MKRIFICLLVISAALTACKGPKDKIVIKDEKGDKVASVSISEATKKLEENSNKAEELKKLTPLSLDQVKALIPNEVLGIQRSSFSANSAAGVSVGKGTYKGEDGKEIELEIIDCAGEMGAAWYSMRFFALWNFQQEDDNGYQKTIDFNGGKAVEKYTKSNDRYELTAFSNDRFIVQVQGEKVGIDDVKKVAKDLNLKVN
jgi:hypothetical protein